MTETLQAIVKWPGGKISESEIILPLLPTYMGRFIDPFVGGGAIYFATHAKQAAINDLSEELIALYRYIQSGDKDFFNAIHFLERIRHSLGDVIDGDMARFLAWFDDFVKEMISKEELKTKVRNWVKTQEPRLAIFTYKQIEAEIFYNEVSINLSRKLLRMEKLSIENGGLHVDDIIDNIETAIHSAFYMYVRHLYNFANHIGLSPAETIATFYYMREFCYSSMFRYNQDKKFNVPYGGMAYNTKNFYAKICRLQLDIYREYLARTDIYNLDFAEFLNNISPNEDDFIFLDPPYDSDFSTYDGNAFGKEDHKRLATFMTNTTTKFMMVIKNTDFVFDLYGTIPNIQVQIFDKRYMVSFQNRNDKQAKHLIITNYPLPIPTSLQLSFD